MQNENINELEDIYIDIETVDDYILEEDYDNNFWSKLHSDVDQILLDLENDDYEDDFLLELEKELHKVEIDALDVNDAVAMVDTAKLVGQDYSVAAEAPEDPTKVSIVYVHKVLQNDMKYEASKSCSNCNLMWMLPVSTRQVVCTAMATQTETVIGVSTAFVDILCPEIQVRVGDFGAGLFRGGGCSIFRGREGLCQGDAGGGQFRGGDCAIFRGRGGLCQGDAGGGYFRGGGLCMQARGLHKSSFPSVLSPT